jgi:hypothetical protein
MITTPSVQDIALEVFNPDRYMILEGSAEVAHDTKGIRIKAKIISPFEDTGFTHEHGPNIIFS